jgi:ComF family protein
MAERWVEFAPLGIELDAIVPVPLHPTRQRQRGYNQAALLARELAAHLHRPVVEGNLVRTRATAPQVDLDAQERRANVQGAFHCTGNGLSGMCVMLVDDVYTTGSTLESACAALRAAGTASVWAYTLARAKAGPNEHLVQSTL